MERKDVIELVQEWKSKGLKVGYTSGVFDILHYGHVDFLRRAADLCDKLVVGVNSDGSVKKYKDPNLPINPAAHRAGIISSLKSVDAVFVFPERRNRTNLELLKPDLYIKAGDYDITQLTSRDVVEKYGGEVIILKSIDEDLKKLSTSKIIERIRNPKQKAAFIDRDGTINKDIEYLHEPEKFEFLPNAIRGIQKLYSMRFRIVVVTCQNGIGLGYFAKEDFFKVNRIMLAGLSEAEVIVDKIYFSTHSVGSENPKKKLIEKAEKDLNLDLSKCIVIGDKITDMQLGKIFGFPRIGIKTGKCGSSYVTQIDADYLADDLLDAANYAEKIDIGE